MAFTAGELEAIGQQLLRGFIQWVVQALVGVVTGQTLSAVLGQLSAWSNDLGTDVSDALSYWSTVFSETGQTTAADLAAFINQIQQIMNAIAVALGQPSGTDYTPTQIQSFLAEIPVGNVAGLETALDDLLSVSTWESFLSDANAALSTGGSDLAHFITGLGAIPQGNIENLGTDLAALLPTSTWTAFLSDANAALGTGGSDLAHLITGFSAIPIGNVASLGDYLTHLASTGLYDASAGFGNLGASVLRNLNGTGQFDATQLTNWASVTGGEIQQAAVSGLTTLASDVSTAATNAANAIGQVADIVNNAGAADAAAVGSALATASSDASSAVGQLQDAATNALGGAAAAATDFGEALSSGITAWFNAWTGSSAAQASATDIASAAATQASATQASATSIADLQASLAGVYGSGVGGLKAVESFSGDTLPADFTSVGATLAAHTAKYNVGSAQGDAQTVTGIWSSPPPSGGYYYLILRANASLTTYVYLKIGSDGSAELGCVVAGIKTVLDTAAPALGSGGLSFRANSPYTLSVDAAYIFNFSFYQANAPGEASYSDSSHVSQLGSSYRTGAFGTDETSLPGSIAAWDFFDTESFGPAAAYVATSESTNSTTYTDLTTTTDQVTVNVGSSGMVIVFLSAHMTNSASNQAYMGFALSGANTGAASDSYCVSAQPYPGGQPYTIGVPYLLTGLSPGATTFKAKYRVQGYTGTFDSRHIAVIPL
ncbi:hypothetical protein [Mycobacterium malmoense]|uniref:hypothetical protein n=1 Tax=Mycobacterium malmoense TaxID=1780 RepID=UPI00114D4BFF|nr:hypothetical protein [Mycobacterium malmoense]